MRVVLATLLVTAIHAWAQAPAANAPAPSASQPASPKYEMPVRNKYAVPKGACPGCAEVRSVRRVTKELPQTQLTQSQPSGLVASVPLGGGKAQVGSSTSLGQEAVRTSTQWEVTLRYDDGRFRLMMLDKQPDFGEGDYVRIDSRGQILPP